MPELSEVQLGDLGSVVSLALIGTMCVLYLAKEMFGKRTKED